jgi:hypothetical protein
MFVTDSYEKGPIVQTKMIDISLGCDKTTMAGAGFGEGDFSFEIVAQGYWWGNQAGCFCDNPAASDGVELSNFQCEEDQTSEGCEDIMEVP